MSNSPQSQPKPTGEDRLFAALCYPFWFVAFPIFSISTERQAKPFVKFHAYQGLALGLLIWLGGITLWHLAAVFGRFILFGLLLYPALKLAEWVAFFTTLFSAAGAWLGYQPKIPFITDFVHSVISEDARESA